MNAISNRTSLIRWIAGGSLGLIAVIQALRALPTMAGRGLSLGALALVALAALTVGGFALLFRARRRIGLELRAMQARPAGGALIATRRARLEAIASMGGQPDPAALAEEAVAAERGQAYLGRYAVAVAVLIGLVGTFSGLAEALRGLPAILNGADPQKLAGLVTAPLAGLELTFAAGIVGILATLALSLVQGDLQLHEELALAKLEEETAHALIPALWPRSHSVEERSLRELVALRVEAAGLRAGIEDSAQRIGSTLAAASERTTRELAQALGAAVEASTGRLADELARGVKETVKAQAEAQAAIVRLADELRVRAEETSTTLSAQLAALHREIAAQAETTQLQLTTMSREQTEATARGWNAVRESIVPALGDARADLHTSRATLDQALLSAVSALESTSSEVGRKLGEASLSFTSTAKDELSATRAAIVEAMTQTSAQMASVLQHETARIDAALQNNAAEMGAVLTDGAARIADLLERSAGKLGEAFTGGAHQLDGVLTETSTKIGTLFGESTARIEALLGDQAQRLDAALRQPTAQLAESAATLAQTSATLAPQLEALAPELRALAQEVALLGARPVREEEQPLFADELVRLGDGMARLEALVKMAQGRSEAAQS